MSLPISRILSLTGLSVLGCNFTRAESPSSGQLDYQTNCMACHQIDIKSVGPSLVYVAATYPDSKLPEFLKWAKKPGKKNAGMIEMPAMSHLTDETLTGIHDYILSATKGKTEKKGSSQFSPYKEPKRELPYVTQAFIPDTSPASVAVVMPGDLSICWDTELCRIRYAWKGSKTNLGNSNYGSKIDSKPFYNEASDNLFSFAAGLKPVYLGYRLIKGYPEFQYKLGDTEVHELIKIGSAPDTWTCNFTLTNAPQNMTLNLAHTGTVTIHSDQGTISLDTLSLSGAAAFTLTFSKP